MSSIRLPTNVIPNFLLEEGSEEKKGKEANINNFTATKLIGQIVKSALGPRAMDKMLVDSFHEITVTSDGLTILNEIDIAHPIGKLMIEIAKGVDRTVGDGTVSVVLLVGALIEKAEELINMGIHPTIIVDGFFKASLRSIEILDEIAVHIAPDEKNALIKVADTSIQSKLTSEYAKNLPRIIVDAVLHISEKMGNNYRVNVSNVKLQKEHGGSIEDTQLIRGIMLNNEVAHEFMPKRIENAKIALLNFVLELSQNQAKFTYRYNIENPEKMERFFKEEDEMEKAMVDKIVQAGANVVVCQKGMSDLIRDYLAEKGILALRRVTDPDMIRVSKATGGNIITDLRDLTDMDLGRAGLVEERQIGFARPVFIDDCNNPKSLTILVRGGSERVVEEGERSVRDALMVVKDVMEKPSILAGGGASEAYVANKLKKWALELSGREQLAVQKFAAALEIIPQVLAENAGMNQIDTMNELRAKQSREKWIGIDGRGRRITNMMKMGVIEPVVVKQQIIDSATEASALILRIDEVFSKPKNKDQAKRMKGLDIDEKGIEGDK